MNFEKIVHAIQTRYFGKTYLTIHLKNSPDNPIWFFKLNISDKYNQTIYLIFIYRLSLPFAQMQSRQRSCCVYFHNQIMALLVVRHWLILFVIVLFCVKTTSGFRACRKNVLFVLHAVNHYLPIKEQLFGIDWRTVKRPLCCVTAYFSQ